MLFNNYSWVQMFCTTTTWNFQKLLSYRFYGGNVVRVPVQFFSLPLIFTLHWWPLAFLILSLPYGAPFVSKLIFSLVINFSSFSVLNHGFKRLKSERRTPWSFHHCFFVVIIRNTLVVYYELQSISCGDRIYRPVIDQLKYYYIVLIFYQIHVKSIS